MNFSRRVKVIIDELKCLLEITDGIGFNEDFICIYSDSAPSFSARMDPCYRHHLDPVVAPKNVCSDSLLDVFFFLFLVCFTLVDGQLIDTVFGLDGPPDGLTLGTLAQL